MTVTLERDGPVGIITLLREHKRNAIDGAMAAALSAALDELEHDIDLRVGVLTGGTEVFSAGTDLAEFDREATRTPRGGEYGIARRHRRTPLIAAVEGPALGGGFEIVLACDLVVAAESARFGLPEVTVGVVASCGGLFRAPRALPLHVANELLLLGEPLDATRGRELGLVNRLVPDGEALAAARRLATRIAKHAPLAMAETLGAVRAIVGAHDDAAWARSDAAVVVASASDDAREGRVAFLERRDPQWRGR